ncbi:MAG: sensor histidine kinase, partial [Flavobacteriales bacterium]
KAEESEKLKSAFLANLSHEIRTPLNAILGFSRLLIEEQAVEEEEKLKFLNHIASGGNRLLRIITDTVDLSKIDVKQLSIENTNFNLNALMDSLQTQFSIQFDNEDVELLATKEFTDETSNISTDETRLAQVLSNMIENAGKFTKKGKIEFGYQRESEMLKFYVRDSGIGIAEKDLEVVFDRFRQVENDMSELNMGTGLGLSISKELIKLMNGEIWVESELNKGSTFYFTIPYSPSNAAKKKTLQKIQENVDLNY